MATDLVLVSATSNEVLFAGNMYKAPPLDRKRRKKWHERHFVLRANRTLELYKSLKAAESHKTPRRIIDLRECISLEIGLEYRNYEHILSMGTFKRTFFFAAPSDALMLQWANVLEKTKSAQDGERIEVLDIGLRKSMHVAPVVHRVKSDSPGQRHSIGSPKRNLLHAVDGKGVKSLGFFARDSTEAYHLRGSGVQDGRNWAEDDPTSRQRAASFSASFEAPNNTDSSSSQHQSRSRSKSPHRVPLKLKAQLSSDSETSRSTSATSQTESFYSDRPSSMSSQQSFNVSPNHMPSPGHTIPPPSHMISPSHLSSRVPPPSSGIATATRTKDGFFVPYRKSGAEGQTNDTHSPLSEKTSPKSSPKSKAKYGNKREFVEKQEPLHRSKPGRNVVRIKHHNKKLDQRDPQDPKASNSNFKSLGARSTPHNDLSTGGINYQSNMKRSFRYRMITLRAEKPIFADNTEDNSDSEDEEEQTSPLHGRIKRKMPYTPIPAPRLNKINPTMENQTKQDKLEKHDEPVATKINQRVKAEPRNTTSLGQPRTNGYTKLKVVGVKSHPTPAAVVLPDVIASKLNSKPRRRQRSSSQSDTSVTPKALPTLQVTSLSQDDILFEDTTDDNPAASQMMNGLSLEEVDVFDILPARPPSNGFMYSSRTSLNSLDDILVAPPPMFSGEGVTQDGTALALESFETELEPPTSSTAVQGATSEVKKPVPKARTREPNNPPVRHFHVGHMTIEPCHVSSTTLHVNSKPLQHLPKIQDDAVNDRNSTESNDTGYTSGASPGCVTDDRNSTKNASMQEFKLKFKDDQDTTADADQTSGRSSHEKGKASSEKHLGYQLSQNSLTSTTSDYVRFYVPLLFYKPSASKGNRVALSNKSSPNAGGSNQFSLEVCLVEDSEELLRELVSVKALEGFTVVECDEIEGSSNVSTVGDDFTVETALEDLEFGFTVTQSTQQDIFMRKVRQFHFDIQRLFGFSKPFSCDVVVRHADQITVLPIEIDMNR